MFAGLGIALRRRRWVAILALGATLAIVAMLTACGSSTKSTATVIGTPAGTYIITVTASSGGTSHTVSTTPTNTEPMLTVQ